VNRPAALAASIALLAVAGLGVAGCASQTVKAASTDVTAVTAPLATSLSTAQGTWAIAVMGGSAATYNNFWQLFVRPAGATRWSLVTPPAVADNGGLVAAGTPSSLLVGFRPSQDLVFSPLATSTDTGKNWTAGLIDAKLANVPDAVSASPSGQQLALLGNGTVETSGAGDAWSRLTTVQAVAASAAGRKCGLVGINASTFWENGVPVVAGACSHSGIAGIFEEVDGAWQAAGPVLAATYAGDRVQVLRLTSTATGTVALLQAGTNLLATWSDGSGWSTPVALGGATDVRASGFGAGGSAWVLLSDGRAETITGPGGSWQALPDVPANTAVLAPGETAGSAGASKAGGAGGAGGYEALAVSGAVLTVWQLDNGSWAKVQVINVPIVYGSSD
jgi:hypothetical protein